jgi:microcompartment protein CcmK/EutM
MRIGQVIGKITMSRQDPAFNAATWLMVSPVESRDLNTCCDKAPRLSKEPSLVVYDRMGAGTNDIVGFVEGAEATAPFDQPTPIDAITVALFDQINYQPYKG